MKPFELVGTDLADVIPLLPRSRRRLVLCLIQAEADLNGYAASECQPDGLSDGWESAREILHDALDRAVAPFVADVVGEKAEAVNEEEN